MKKTVSRFCPDSQTHKVYQVVDGKYIGDQMVAAVNEFDYDDAYHLIDEDNIREVRRLQCYTGPVAVVYEKIDKTKPSILYFTYHHIDGTGIAIVWS